MTREELKVHCEKQIENCEMWARCHEEEPHGKVYEEHKLILELLKQETVSKESYDHEYFLRKEFEIKIARLEQTLNKIRAEIEKWHKEGTNWSDIRLMEIENIVNEVQGRK